MKKYIRNIVVLYMNMKKVMCILVIAFLLQFLEVNEYVVYADESEDITNNGIYSITNSGTGDYLDICGCEESVSSGSNSKEECNHLYKFVYDRDADAYRIYVICNRRDTEKVLDVQMLNAKDDSCLDIQAYSPVDDTAQLWVVNKNADGSYTLGLKENNSLILCAGNEATGSGQTTMKVKAVVSSTVHTAGIGFNSWNLTLEIAPLLMDPYDCLWSYMFRQPKMARHISQSYSSTHYGVDIISAAGDIANNYPVYLVSTGTVLYANYSSSAGYFAVIRLNDGYTVRYLHLKSRPNITDNQTVTSSNMVGYVGNTGDSTGAHLHFDVNTVGAISGGDGSSDVNYGTTVDPLEFFPDYAFTY